MTTGSGFNFLAADGVSATYTRAPGETVGSYAITATLSSTVVGALNNYTITNTGATFKILFAWDGFLQPINDTAHQTGVLKASSSSDRRSRRSSSSRTPPAMSSSRRRTRRSRRSSNLGSCDSTTAPETFRPLTPDAGANFNWHGSQYHYNWSTKGLTSGEYRIYANLADGTARYVDICLTK